jgi:hypothetical protein
VMGRPMKYLSGIQCFLEIKSRSREGFQAGHVGNLDWDDRWCKERVGKRVSICGGRGKAGRIPYVGQQSRLASGNPS